VGHGRSRDSEQTRYWPLHLTRRVALAAAGGASIRARLPDHSRTAVILACSALPGRWTGLAALPIVTTGLPAMERPSDPPPVDSVTMVKTLRSSASAANGSNHYYLRGNAVLLSLLSISRTLPQIPRGRVHLTLTSYCYHWLRCARRLATAVDYTLSRKGSWNNYPRGWKNLLPRST